MASASPCSVHAGVGRWVRGGEVGATCGNQRAAEMRSNGLKGLIDLQRAWCRWTAQDLVDKG